MTTHEISSAARSPRPDRPDRPRDGPPDPLPGDRWHGHGPALLDALWDSSDDALLGVDGQGLVTVANRSAARIFGLPAEDLLGHSVVGLFPAHVIRHVEALVARVLSGEPVFGYELEAERRDGLPVPLSLSALPVASGSRPLDGSGPGTEAAVLIGRDITERQMAQAMLAEVECRFRESEALARIGTWLWDVRTGAVQWSDELHRIGGIEPLEFPGTLEAHLSAIHPDDRERIVVAMRHSLATVTTFDQSYRLVRPDGEVRVLAARASPTTGSTGSAVGLRGMAQDVTELRSPASSARAGINPR